MAQVIESIEGTLGRRVVVRPVPDFPVFRATLLGDGEPVFVDYGDLDGARVWGRLACGAASSAADAVRAVSLAPLG